MAHMKLALNITYGYLGVCQARTIILCRGEKHEFAQAIRGAASHRARG